MVTHRQIAKFCNSAYSNRHEEYNSGDWKKLLTSGEANLSNYGFYAVAFINEETKEIVIANRGTEISKANPMETVYDLISDAQLFWGYTPWQFTYAADQFVEVILDKLGDKAQEYKFITTGHSLGSVLSNLENARLVSKGYQASSINIDSPGSKPVLEDFIKNNNLKMDPLKLDITTFNAPTNLINTSNLEVGKVYQCDMPKVDNFVAFLSNTSLARAFGGKYINDANATLIYHSLNNITKSIDPETDTFKCNDFYTQMVDGDFQLLSPIDSAAMAA